MASMESAPKASLGDKSRMSEVMNGGPVGTINGLFINGNSTSTNSTSSRPSTPHIHFNDHSGHDHNGHDQASQTSDDTPHAQPHPSPPRAGTWPRSPLQPAQLSPSEQEFLASHREHHKSHPTAPPTLHENGPGGPRSRTYARVRSYADGDGGAAHRFPRISRPVELLRGSYDCVVIGSGYGGAVAASRMARAGETVCLLERGKEKWPGEYPSGTKSALGELHWSGTVAPSAYFDGIGVDGGDPTGMYHLIFGKGQHAVVGNGAYAPDFIGAFDDSADICSRSRWD